LSFNAGRSALLASQYLPHLQLAPPYGMMGLPMPMRRVGHEESGVYVIGDAACFPLQRNGGDLCNIQHVQHARRAPACVEGWV